MISLVFLLYYCSLCVAAQIYHLNESTYERMPPLFDLDEYEFCLNGDRGIYCLVRMDLVGPDDSDLIQLIRDYSAVTTKHYNHSYLERGICVTRTCRKYFEYEQNVSDFDANLEACLNETIYKDYELKINLTKIYYCKKHEDGIQIDSYDWIVFGIFGFFVAINAIGTVYHQFVYRREEEKNIDSGNKYLLCFSIKRNWGWLIQSEPKDPRIRRLKGFYGVRTITNVLIIFAHIITILGNGFVANPRDFEEAYDHLLYQMIFNGVMVVHVFFCISGFLLVYNFLIRVEKLPATWASIPFVMFLRWWRLTPVYALIIAFNSTWMRHLSSGPLWDHYVTNSFVRDCRRYWWQHLIYINNYMTENKFCALHTWHVASDTQLFFIGLVAYVLTMKRGRKIVMILLLITSLILPSLHVWFQDLDGIMILMPEFFRTLNNDSFYLMCKLGHNNLVSYTVGMASGNLVYNWQKRGVDISKNKVFAKFLWLVIPAIALIMYSGQMFYIEGPRASVFLRMAYASLHRLIIAVIIAGGLIGMVMKSPIILRNILEWKGWVLPGRLTYCVYLIHFNFIHIISGIKITLNQAAMFNMFITTAGVTCLSYILALLLFLLVEGPLNNLMKTWTDSVKKE
ncbi:nose resistant to fluoxetine protein 6 [Bombyx mori]|uniref:Acyltransferase 3 domain-containing protein n=1 Tax=Bombyx mori TaxID=7091 RepID=A0A8R2G8G6_BOMMO|nr:nose resistant to fluoxetine protein 6 isoform X3 [Bombyx mori]